MDFRLKSASQLAQITPRLGSENTLDNFTLDFTLRVTAVNPNNNQASVNVFYRTTYRITGR